MQSKNNNKTLREIGEDVRRHVVEMSERGKCGETGSSLSISDLLAVLYFRIMKVDPERPNEPDRDRFILSKGHGAAAYYAVLAMRGYFPMEILHGLRVDGGLLHAHPSRSAVPGIEASTGSLGHGLSIGAGMALSLKGSKNKVYVLIGDGECNEGSIWEAAQFIGQHEMSNIVVVVDDNKFQGFAATSETNRFDLGKQWESFGWNVLRVDGHDPDDIEKKLLIASSATTPTVLIANTVNGKGIPSIENTLRAHYYVPTIEDVERMNNKNKK